MYILFINSSDTCDIYIFFAQFNNNSNKKNCSTQPMWVRLGWVGLM